MARLASEQSDDEPPGGADTDPAAGQGTHGGAGHLGVDVLVDDVVEGAAGRAHQRRAEGEQGEESDARPGPAFGGTRLSAIPCHAGGA